ncbi:DUF2244 domain-containing protein [Litorivita pollutaquae]|uniref:DUF2244 domain-containing protein n=1 Tax=Litorivita pollutaquae TaxID=2200892 RepID=A0A2V4NUU4_9RHOB|nr:DUF2244 domain-containing protein [Litorivita pollutaquae]PYC48786.1 DUF2244 domain-containing protein [Litorivita pollutaquae]
MPYEWTIAPSGPDRLPRRVLSAWPHRSLPKAGFAAVILGAFLFITIPLLGVLGTKVLWGLLPFALLTIGALWWGIARSYKDGEVLEELEIDADTARLSRRSARSTPQVWDCNTYWLRPEIHPSGGPVPSYITLAGGSRVVELGAFLTEDERKRLYSELIAVLKDIKSTAPSP